MITVDKFNTPSMHGPWYPGTISEKVTIENDTSISVTYYTLVRGEKKTSFHYSWLKKGKTLDCAENQ